MRWTLWLVPVVTAVVAIACAEKPKNDDETVHPPPTVLTAPPPARDGGVAPPVAPAARDGGTDAGVDAGVVVDAGVDAGTDAGQQASLPLPSAPNWQFFGPQHGGPREVYGVSSDRAGNVWVAGGAEGLFLLTPGASTYRKFGAKDGLNTSCDVSGTTLCKVVAVTGGAANVVYVGYEGVGTDSESDPMWQQRSGDADRVTWNGATLRVKHFDLSSPPGLYEEYPQGREKLRTVHRILYDASTGNVWFGSNHGVAVWEARGDRVWEHQHAAINGFKLSAAEDPSGASYTMLSGDWPGLGLDESGDLWMGGSHRVARLRYGSEGGQFWAAVDPIVDVWPDAVEDHGRPEQRVDDEVRELVVESGGRIWVGGMQGLARLSPTGGYVVPKSELVDPKVTALEKDPADGSLWVGHLWGGITRLRGGGARHYSWDPFGRPLIDFVVRDLQSDRFGGGRRILVAFSGGAIGIYTGP